MCWNKVISTKYQALDKNEGKYTVAIPMVSTVPTDVGNLEISALGLTLRRGLNSTGSGIHAEVTVYFVRPWKPHRREEHR